MARPAQPENSSSPESRGASDQRRQRNARRRQRARAKRVEIGFFFFRGWGLFMLPFTRSIKRLGESAAGFQRLWEACQRLLVGPWSVVTSPWSADPAVQAQSPAAAEEASDHGPGTKDQRKRTGNQEHRTRDGPARFRHLAVKLARTLAQVLWLRPRVMRERARDTALRLEARLRTAAELQAILRGQHGAEAQARMIARLSQVMGPEYEEYKALKMFSIDPTALWPRRLVRRLAEMVLEVIDERGEQKRERARLRRRVDWLLKAYAAAAEKLGGRTEATGAGLSSAGRGLQLPPEVEKASLEKEAAELRRSIQETRRKMAALDQQAEDDPELEVAGDADIKRWAERAAEKSTLQGRLKRLRARLQELRPELAKWKAIEQVESRSAEALGNPQVAPGRVARALSGAESKPKKRPPRGQGPTRVAGPPDRISVKVEMDLGAMRRARYSPEERARREEYESYWAGRRGATVEALRRAQAEFPERVVTKIVRQVGRWWAESREGLEQSVHEVRESFAPGMEDWWPEGREQEIRAEVEATRLATQLAYPELKQLVAEAFGLQPPATPVIPGELVLREGGEAGVQPFEAELTKVTRLLWVAIHHGERQARWEMERYEASLDAGELPALLAADREAEFAVEERLARASEALRRLLVARFPDPLEGPESASGRRWTLRDEFERLRPAAVWFDAEARQVLRQDLGLEPYAEDFETPEPPEDFVLDRRTFLNELGYICYVRECVWQVGESMQADAAELEIFKNLFHSVAEEMGAALCRSAFSPNIKERRDYSCAVFDGQGRVVAMGDHMPVHLGSMPMSVAAAVDALDVGRGDIAMLNDPYAGGTHLPDITLVMPVLVRGARRPLFYVANRAHHADVGGARPASMGLSEEIYQEGLRIPPVILARAGNADRNVMALLLANVRTPVEREGDLAAQVAACRLGERRLTELAEKYGTRKTGFYLESLQRYAQRLMRAGLGRIPEGLYEAEDFLDDDGYGSGPVRLRVAIRVIGRRGAERAVIDFAGTSPACRGSINAVMAITVSAVFYVFRCLLGEDVPACAGLMAPIEVRAPEGSLLNALPPAAVAAGNVETSQRIVDVLLRALATALPERIPAASSGTMNNLSFGGIDPRTRRPFAYYETIAGGMGARPSADGLTAVHTHMTNSLNTPIEAFESAYPVRVRRYSVRRGSGGGGRFRGGDGVIREIEFLTPVRGSILSDRRKTEPYGLAGGEPGRPGRNLLLSPRAQTGGWRRRRLASKAAFEAYAGSILRIETPGGGGWGQREEQKSEGVQK